MIRAVDFDSPPLFRYIGSIHLNGTIVIFLKNTYPQKSAARGR